jgi:hypothetical protein
MKQPQITSVRAALLQSLDTAFDKLSWHGTNLTGAIRGIAARPASRNIRGRKSVWQQVLHAAYWKQRALNKISGITTPFPRRGSNWPRVPNARDEPAWRADIKLLRDIHARLRGAVASRSSKQLNGMVVWLIHGAAAHDLYHAGQIKLMRRLLKA